MSKSHVKTHVKGFIRSVSEASLDSDHPLQSRLSIVLTDFGPNDNKQGIPLSEKEKLLKSALFMPLKINFDGDGYLGHDGAIPIGPIISTAESINENEQPIIIGDVIAWKELYPEVIDYLKESAKESPIGTSWEMYYSDSEVDSDGVEWLKNIEFAGTCIVQTPAYGPERTRILAIAEKAKPVKEESEITSKSMEEKETTEVFDFSSAIAELYKSVFSKELEAEMSIAISEVRDLIQSLRDGIAEKDQELLVAHSKLNEMVAEKEKEQAEAARKDKLNKRRKYLSEAGIEVSDEDWQKRETFYDEMSEPTFSTYVEDLKAIRFSKSEKKPVLPEPISYTSTITINDIAQALKQR